MNSSSIQRCGFCSILRGLVRRAFCIGSRRGSTESYYREIGDQDTLKIEDRSSDLSDEAEDMNQETLVVPELHVEPTPTPEEASPDDSLDLTDMPMRGNPLGKFQTLHRRRRKLPTEDVPVERIGQLDQIYQSQVQNLLKRTTQWKFNAFALEAVSAGRGLPMLCMHLFQNYGLMSQFQLEPANMWRLFTLIQDNYHSNNPYHNSTHAADVTQAMHCFLQQKQIRAHVKPAEIMTSLLAAITHDVDHPGVNQPFLVGTSNHLANLYENTSVLENHHWRVAVSCLIESCAFDHIPDMLAMLKKELRLMILATDITKQQNYLAKFKNYLDMNRLDMKTTKHRRLVLQIALKCADISNPCRPWEISRKWSLKVCEEFFRQGDYERDLALPVSLICDRHSTSIPKIQTTFLNFVVVPLIKEWNKFLHNPLSKEMLHNLIFNLSKWEMLVVHETACETEDTAMNQLAADADKATRSASGMSESTEALLPLRRSSLTPAKQNIIKAQLRRFSVPLSVFQDTIHRNKARAMLGEPIVPVARSGGAGTMMRRNTKLKPSTSGNILSWEYLIPESTITSLTTPVLATRLKTLKVTKSSKLGRQQTVPPVALASQVHAIVHQPPHKTNENASCSKTFKMDLTDIIKFGKSKGAGIFKTPNKRIDIEEIEELPDDEPHTVEKANEKLSLKGAATGRRESATVGSQLRENLVSVQLDTLESDQLLQRRKSVPAEVVASTLKEKVMREVPAAIPHILHQALASKDSWTQRRGSAPSPAAYSELRGLAGPGAMTHSASGGRRKLSPIGSCQQWHPKTTCNVQEKTYAHLPRRSSLPAEVSRLTETMKTSNSN